MHPSNFIDTAQIIADIKVGLEKHIKSIRCGCPVCGSKHAMELTLPNEKFKKGCYYCWSCKSSGNLVNFVNIYLEKTLKDSYKLLNLNCINFISTNKFSAHDRREYAIRQKFSNNVYNSPEDIQNFKPSESFLTYINNSSKALLDYIKTETTENNLTNYLKSHKLYNTEIIEKYSIGYEFNTKIVTNNDIGYNYEGNKFISKSLIFPLYNYKHRLIGIKIRTIGEKKYINICPRKRAFFPRQYEANKPLMLVESENDAILLDYLVGDIVSVFSGGGVAAKFDSEIDQIIKQAPWFIVAFDSDEAGQNASQTMKQTYPNAHCVRIPKFWKDPGSVPSLEYLRGWVIGCLPPVLQNRACAFWKTELTQFTTIYWEITRGINTNTTPCLDSNEALQQKMSILTDETCVALALPPFFDEWSICSNKGLYMLKKDLAESGYYHLEKFPLPYITLDPYESHSQLELLHIADKSVGSVGAFRKWQEHCESQHWDTQCYPDVSNAFGLQYTYKEYCNRVDSSLVDFVHKLEAARQYLVNSNGLSYQKDIFLSCMESFNEDPNKQGLITQCNRIAQEFPEKIPIHYQAFGASTGRFSTKSPNIQGIHKKLRKSFIAPEGWTYLSIDFHMIQPRIIASECKDENFREPFVTGQDYYKYWIRKVVGFESEITKPIRNHFKKLSLAVLYGMKEDNFVDACLTFEGDQSALAPLELSTEKARFIYNNFWVQFPVLDTWYKNFTRRAFDCGYSTTHTGRRIFLDTSNKAYSASKAVCYFAQGTEVEIMLDAILLLGAKLQQSYIALSMHDELLLLCPDNELEDTRTLTIESLTQAFLSQYPEECTNGLLETASSKCWGDLK